MNVLGIESSCDETSVAVISDGRLAANLISSQDFHVNYGGVIPELSSRAHLQILIPLLKDALKRSHLNIHEVDLITATAGPGLIGALLVGLTFAKSLAYSLAKPFIGVDHIEGHIYSGFLMEEKPEFPYLALVVSGGHTMLLLVKSFTEFKSLGSTVDDAAGEAFDKVAKLLGLEYPGGPQIQKLAEKGNADKFAFPLAELKNPYDFSFSGLKTAVLRFINKNYPDQIPAGDLPDIAASFQNAVVKALIQKTERAVSKHNVKSLSLVGGVAANKVLRNQFRELADKNGLPAIIPDLQFCGDNAAMIAFRGLKMFENGIVHNISLNAYPSLSYKTI
ncbi:MAG: tRNA (adenosine(37)-N6)-threonylcarbamoyltransferase complex transferase subunit TsaD [Ignavibacteriaceae bacterium]